MQFLTMLFICPLLFHRQVLMVSTVQKTVEDPVKIQQVQNLDKVVDLAIVEQRQVPMVLTVQRPVEIPQVRQLQFIDKFVNIPVVSQRLIPKVQTSRRRCIYRYSTVCSTSTRWSMSLLCWSCWFHRSGSWRRQLATHC